MPISTPKKLKLGHYQEFQQSLFVIRSVLQSQRETGKSGVILST